MRVRRGFELSPGVRAARNSPEIVWPLLASMFVGNVMLVLLNLPLVGLWVSITRIPPPLLNTVVLAFSCFGAYTLNGSAADIGIVVVFGLVGFLVRRNDFPILPAIMGLVLGGYLETFYRQAMQANQGDATVFATRPVSAVLLAATALVLLLPAARYLVRRRRDRDRALLPDGATVGARRRHGEDRDRWRRRWMRGSARRGDRTDDRGPGHAGDPGG